MPQTQYNGERSARANWPEPPEKRDNLIPGPDGSLSIQQLETFFRDQWYEPEWRAEAELDSAYYDGDQLTAEALKRMQDNGILPAVVNFCAPTVDAVSGLEIITRQDFRLVARDDESYQSAQAMNEQLHQALRMTRFNQKISDQYKGAIIRGMSWIEVSRNPDPFAYPYRVINIPWREMYFDWRAREPDLSDMRYIIRRKWYDEDQLKALFPESKHRNIIKLAAQQQGSVGADDWLTRFDHGFYEFPDTRNLGSHKYSEDRWILDEEEWLNNARGRIPMIECLYWIPRTVEVLKLPTGHVIELDRDDPNHLQLLTSGQAVYAEGKTKTWRQAFIVGKHKLTDQNLANNEPHYVPMCGYRKDNNGAPYGLIRRMRSPQDSYNARNTRIIWDTMNRTYLIDEDAVDDTKTVAQQLNKPVAAITLRGERRSEEGIRKMVGTEATAYTYQMLQEAKLNIYDVSGLRPEFMGQVQSAGQSGVAIDQLIEQSSKVLGPVADNLKQAKMKAGKLLLAMLINDLKDQNNLRVDTHDRSSGKRRQIVVNAMTDNGRRDNDLLRARMELELEPTPSTETYRQQKFAHITEVLKSMPPEMTAGMMDIVVRAAQLPMEEEIVERIRAMTGFGPEPQDPEMRAQLEAQQQQQQAMEQKMQELQMMLAEGEALLQQAKAEGEQAKTEKLQGADTELTEAKTLAELAKADAVPDEQERKRVESQAGLLEAAARLQKEKNAPPPGSTATAKKAPAKKTPAKKTAAKKTTTKTTTRRKK